MFARHVSSILNAVARPLLVRHSSSIADLESSLRKSLTSRRLPLLYDYLSPQPSYLLTKSLTDFLPSSLDTKTTTQLPSTLNPRLLPPGHHIAYFPTPTTASELLPDGTDVLHSPGPPFGRRLWSGGRIRFPPEGGPRLDCGRTVCLEGIRDVRVTGQEGNEKVYVEIERRVARVEEHEEEDNTRARVWTDYSEEQGAAALIERRDLVFLRDQLPDASPPSQSSPRRPLSAPSGHPDFSHTLTPTSSLLFRYSALMFNAHAIHLDPLYTKEHEGHPGLLVTGPLLLTFILTCLRHHIASATSSAINTHTIREITYRNLAPVYVDQPMTICLREKQTSSKLSEGSKEWDTYILGPDNGLRVRGTAKTAPVGDQEGWLKSKARAQGPV